MKVKIVPAIALCLSILSTPIVAHAQTQIRVGYACFPHAVIEKTLGQKYQEKVAAMGIATDQRSMVQLFVSESGTWTIVVTYTNGLSCISASGERWASIEKLGQVF